MIYRAALMIRTAAAEQIPLPDALAALLGVPTQPDPENPEETIPVTGLSVADYFRNYRDQMPAVQSEMIERVAGDRVAMFPDGYSEGYMFPVIMADRVPGADERTRQLHREALKAIFDQLTAGAGASWVGRYLSTAPEIQAYTRLIEEPEL